MKIEFNAPFILAGIDFEGDTREIGCSSYQKALSIAEQCASRYSPHPPWLRWEIWGNDSSRRDEWRAIATSP